MCSWIQLKFAFVTKGSENWNYLSQECQQKSTTAGPENGLAEIKWNPHHCRIVPIKYSEYGLQDTWCASFNIGQNNPYWWVRPVGENLCWVWKLLCSFCQGAYYTKMTHNYIEWLIHFYRPLTCYVEWNYLFTCLFLPLELWAWRQGLCCLHLFLFSPVQWLECIKDTKKFFWVLNE